MDISCTRNNSQSKAHPSITLFWALAVIFTFFLFAPISRMAISATASLIVEIPKTSQPEASTDEIILLGAIQRWDSQGNHRQQPDPKEKIDAPRLDAQAVHSDGNQWVFQNLPKGEYDLILLGKNHLRIEGFTFVPVKEFDPPISRDAKVDEETRDSILEEIKPLKQYENIVEPLYLAGDAKTVRVLMMLLRDKPTSYESEVAGATTLRFELWQFTQHPGAWQKEKRTKVFDRVLMPRNELRSWTWLWDPKLGGIAIQDQQTTTLKYSLPDPKSETALKGFRPQ